MATEDDKKTAGKKKKKKRPASAVAAEPAPKAKAKAQPREDAAAREADEAERDGESSDALVVRGGESTSLDAPREEPPAAAARGAEDEEEEEQVATQLGTEKYVLAGFFAAALVGAYVLGKTIHGVWAYLSNRDWFSQNLTALAAVPDEDKTTIGMVIAGVVAFVVVFRAYKRADVRAWCDEVATELTKVKWPTRKDVTNSTLVVIAATSVATVYLALLDRLWGFVTNLVYGTGS